MQAERLPTIIIWVTSLDASSNSLAARSSTFRSFIRFRCLANTGTGDRFLEDGDAGYQALYRVNSERNGWLLRT